MIKILESTKKVLQKASKKNYAVGAFNINNMEVLQAIVKAGAKLKSPLIIQTSEGAIKYAGLEYLKCLTETASNLNNIPICLHLDHGKDQETIKRCIKEGYSSVMIDGSHYDFKNNVKVTKKVVNLAHKKGVSVEAELGTIGGTEDNVTSKNILYTDPEKAKEFVDKTGVDFLAIAIGTSHGAHKFKSKPKLRFDILKQIKQKLKMPLVLHGASAVPKYLVNLANKYGAKLDKTQGVSDPLIKKAVKLGINKINTDTDLKIAFEGAVRKFETQNPKDFDPRHMLNPARDLIQKVVEHRIKTFGSNNRG